MRVSLERVTALRLLPEELVDRELCNTVADGEHLRRVVSLPETEEALLPVDDSTRLGYRLVLGLVALVAQRFDLDLGRWGERLEIAFRTAQSHSLGTGS